MPGFNYDDDRLLEMDSGSDFATSVAASLNAAFHANDSTPFHSPVPGPDSFETEDIDETISALLDHEMSDATLEGSFASQTARPPR